MEDKVAKEQKVGSTKKIAKNTLMLYFRQILIMLVSLYTVRVVLNVLGAEDYGIYNLVAGVVTMFSFLSGTMASASQRYFSFDLGKGDIEHLKITFNVTFQIYLLLTVLIVVLAETIGVWFVNNKLVFSMDRMIAVNVIYQAAILSFVFTLMTSPYMACIIAHENMQFYAYVSLVEAGFKLIIVIFLKYILWDKLITYGCLLAFVSAVVTFIYRSICRKNYEESKIKKCSNKELFSEIINYSVWNLFGASIGVVKNQIMNIVLNLFFGPIVNAARGIASQVSYAVSTFANNFCTALRPQVIKSYAAGDSKSAHRYVILGCKLSFFLMYIFVLPLIFKMEYVLVLWLKTPPEYAILFTQLVLIDVMIDSFNSLIMTLIHATGRIKLYQSVVGGIQLLNLPISYIFLKTGYPPFFVFYISIGLTCLAAIARVVIAKRNAGFSIRIFLLNCFFPIVGVSVLSILISFLFNNLLSEDLIGFVIFVVVCVLSVSISFWFIGLNRVEKNRIKHIIKGKLRI